MSDLSPPTVLVYVLSGCPHCTRATSLLRARGVAHDVVSGDGLAGFRDQLRSLTGGSTVPQVVIDGHPIGGADRLAQLDRSGVLQALIARESLPVTRVRKRRLRPAGSRWIAEAYDASGLILSRTARTADSARQSLTGALEVAAAAS